MSKFDNELQKILLEQNLIDENWFTDGAKYIGNKIKNARKAIVDTGKKVLNWSIDKIQSFFQKLWDLLTPDNAEETNQKAKSIISKIPGDAGKQLQKTIQISQSDEYKTFLQKRASETFTKQQYEALSNQQKKDFIKKCSSEYINEEKIISEEIISEAILTSLILLVLSLLGLGIFVKTQTEWLDSDAEKAKNAAKNKSKQADIQRQEKIKQDEHQKYLDQQQRKQLFQLVAQSNYFN